MRYALALVLSSGLVLAQNARVQVQNLEHPDGPMDWNTFGEGAAISGDRAAIGTSAGQQDVVVYRWQNDQWEVEATLPTPVGEPNAFGETIAMDGDVLAVGAPHADLVGGATGAVVVYRYSGGAWNQEAILTAFDANNQDLFGTAIAVHGDRLIASSPRHRVPGKSGLQHGAVYAFEFVAGQWELVGKLFDPSTQSYDWFGYSLDLDGDRMIVGELPGGESDWGFSHRGEAHVYEWANARWNHRAQLKSPNNSKTYALSVAVDGDRIAVTDYFEGHRVYEGGGATWTQTALLESENDGVEPGPIVLDGDNAFFGMYASQFLDVPESKIVRYWHDGNGWNLEDELHLADPIEQYTRLLAADGDKVFGFASVTPKFLGRVYAYDLSKPSLGQSICAANGHGDGGPGRIQAFGSLAVADNDLFLAATRLKHDEFAMFLMSDTPGSSQLGHGHLCLSGSLVRLPQTLAESGPNGAIGAHVDLTDLPGNTSFLPGSTWYLQAWFRQGFQMNLSDAIAITWQ